MLSCFRSIVRHRTSCFRPALTAASASSFSTSLTRRGKPSGDYNKLIDALQEEGNKEEEEEDEPRITTSFMAKDQPSWGPKTERLQRFRRNVPLHPSEFSYKRRVVAFRRVPKPWDLGPVNRVARHRDIFHQMEIDPVDECMNPMLLSHFVTNMGRIQTRAQTHLTTRSQRRLGKAIKRAKMMGIIPIHSKSLFGLLRFPK